jgi:D-alanyl-D-alanine dipeptidase
VNRASATLRDAYTLSEKAERAPGGPATSPVYFSKFSLETTFMTKYLFAPIVLAALTAQAAPLCPAPATAALSDATRLLVVTTTTWNDSSAKLRLYERTIPSDAWRPAGATQPAVIGKAGMAWGFPFAKQQAAGEPLKHEGDGRTPAGVFKLGKKFGFDANPAKNFLMLDPNTACVDDAASSHYNTVVEENQVPKDWKSAEMMREIDLYKIGFLVDYPSDAKAQAGSCIFVHIWRTAGRGTSGCLASTEQTIAGLQAWIKDTTPAAVVFLPEKNIATWLTCIPGVTATE